MGPLYKSLLPQLVKRWIKHYPTDSAVGFLNTYSVDSDLSRWIALSNF